MQQVHLGHSRPPSRPRGAPALLMLGCALLSSCSGPTIALRALAPVNLNPDGESLPVKVRIYALRDDARFRGAPFADLWTKDREALGDDRLQDPKVVLVPPASLAAAPLQIELAELPKEARFLGVVALIQHADQPDRRRVVIARKDIGAQTIELVGSSIVMHDRGDPVPGRTAPHDEPPPPATVPAPTVAAAPPPGPPAAIAPANAPEAAAAGPAAGAEAIPASADKSVSAPPGQADATGSAPAGRGRRANVQGQ